MSEREWVGDTISSCASDAHCLIYQKMKQKSLGKDLCTFIGSRQDRFNPSKRLIVLQVGV